MIEVVFLRPWWLLAALALLAEAWFVRRRGRLAGPWRQAADPHLLAAMAARGGLTSRGGGRPLAALAVSALLVIGLAGPAL